MTGLLGDIIVLFTLSLGPTFSSQYSQGFRSPMASKTASANVVPLVDCPSISDISTGIPERIYNIICNSIVD